MRLRFTVFLLILNLLTCGLLVYLGSQSEEAEASSNSLSVIIGQEVIETDRIELSGERLEAPFVLERDGSAWKITEPMQWSANFYAVNRILNQLQFLEEEAAFSINDVSKTGQSLADYGLDDPSITLVLGRGNDALKISLGSNTGIGNKYYLLGPDGENVYVVNRKVIDSLLVDLADLRTREIFDIPVFEIGALGLQIKTPEAGDLKVRLAQTNNGWIFEAPLSATADPALVSNTINVLSAAKVEDFEVMTNDPILLGLENPFMQVTLHGNKRRQTLLLGNRKAAALNGKQTYYAKLEDNPTVFTVLAKPFDELREAQDALRERNFMMTFETGAITSINITEGDIQVRLQKLETGSWQVIQGGADSDIQPRRADNKLMEKLLTDIHSLRATGFAVDTPTQSDLARLGFNQPRRKISLSQNGSDDLLLTLAHPESENAKLYARRSDTNFVYEVPRRKTLQSIPLSALHYRSRKLDTLPEAAKIVGLKLENLITGDTLFEQTLGSESIFWENTLERLEADKKAAVLTLIKNIRNFYVDTYLIDGYEESYPVDADKTLPWTYRLTADISLPGGESDRKDIRTYTFTERLSGTVQVAGSELFDVIFEIPQNMVDALYTMTDTMQLPPELNGDSIPQPVLPSPVTEPAPTQATTGPVE